jgi:hypothetical protein
VRHRLTEHILLFERGVLPAMKSDVSNISLKVQESQSVNGRSILPKLCNIGDWACSVSDVDKQAGTAIAQSV